MLNYSFIYSKPQCKIGIYFLIVLVLIFIPFLFLQTYSSYKTTGILECKDDTCILKLAIPYDKLFILDYHPQIEYLNNKYVINNIEQSEPYLNNNIPVVDVAIATDYISDNKVIEFRFLYKKQRIITKIIGFMKEWFYEKIKKWRFS